MNKIENIIRKNREAFDAFDPADSHLKNFRHRLNASEKRPAFRIPVFVKAVAAILVIALASILVYEQTRSIMQRAEVRSLSDVSTELAEVEMYYTRLIEKDYSRIQEIGLDDQKQKEVLISELKEMDRLYMGLQADLKTNPTDERVINAMIAHYQMKLEIMNQIILHLERIKPSQSNNKGHESKDI